MTYDIHMIHTPMMMRGDNVLATLAGSGRRLRLGVHSGHAPGAL